MVAGLQMDPVDTIRETYAEELLTDLTVWVRWCGSNLLWT